MIPTAIDYNYQSLTSPFTFKFFVCNFKIWNGPSASVTVTEL